MTKRCHVRGWPTSTGGSGTSPPLGRPPHSWPPGMSGRLTSHGAWYSGGASVPTSGSLKRARYSCLTRDTSKLIFQSTSKPPRFEPPRFECQRTYSEGTRFTLLDEELDPAQKASVSTHEPAWVSKRVGVGTRQEAWEDPKVTVDRERI